MQSQYIVEIHSLLTLTSHYPVESYDLRFLKRELLKTRRSTRGDLSNEQTYEACNVAYKTCSRILEKQKSIGEEPPYKYSHSGTTAISVYIQSKQKRLFISNVGDSRAVLARDKESNLGKENTAIPLSWDQTPYRGSERRRIREAGARILSMDQVLGISPTADDDGTKEIHDYRDLIEGEEEESDLRVWDKENDEPGVTHTRSIGDSIAKRLGVIAEPEMVILDLETDNEIVVLASDGIFEFLTNQSVIDICVNRKDEGPLKACEEVIEKSRKYWVEYENFVDDMTMICLFISQL